MSPSLLKIYYWLPSVVKDLLLSVALFKQRKLRYGHFYKDYLKRYQYFYSASREIIEEYQLAELKKLLIECGEVPYYAQTFKKQNLNNAEIISASTTTGLIEKVPQLQKATLQSQNPDLLNQHRKVSYTNFTSGTSGTPTQILYDKESFQIGFALWRKFHDAIGLPEKFKSVRLSGKILINPEAKEAPFWVYNIFDRQLFMSTYHLNPTNFQAYINKLNKFKPDFIDSYPSAIYVLARYINQERIKLSFAPIAIATTAETLPENYRTEIEKAFSCKVYNQYSSSEGGPFIAECSAGQLHMYTFSGIFEFYNAENKPAQPGELAELVVTSLRQWKTPLIRYRTGDWVKVSSQSFTYQRCECGCQMPTVEEIVGREDDILYTDEKGYVGRLDPAYKGLAGIIRSKIIQHSKEYVEVLNLADFGYSETVESKLKSNLQERLGKQVVIDIKTVDELPLGASGKFKAVERRFKIDK